MTLTPAPDIPDVDETIGRNVHYLLWQRRLTQLSVARSLGLTPSVLSKKLRGASGWSAKQVAAVAALLDVRAGELYETGGGLPLGPKSIPDVNFGWSKHQLSGLPEKVIGKPRRLAA